MRFYSLIFFFLPVFCLAQSDGNDVPYTVNRGVIYCDKGLPQLPRWFADSRLAFRFDYEGIAQVDYYNPVRGQGLPTIFLRQLWDGFRYFIEKDGRTFKPEYRNTRIWPFGIESEWSFQNIIIKQRVMAVDESIVMQLILPDSVPTGLHLKMEFYESFGLSRGSDDDLRFSSGGSVRQWDKWAFSPEPNILAGGFMTYPAWKPDSLDRKAFQTVIAIGADFPITNRIHPINTKHLLISPVLAAGRTYSIVISFGQSQSMVFEKNQKLVRGLSESIRHQFKRYQKVADNSPVLKSHYSDLNNFISLAPMYHEALKITSRPGAIRAKTSNYWVWAWDGITCNEATAYWGDVEHIKNMLQFYQTTADPEKGIGHAFAYDMTPVSISALPTQGMYISLLQLYYANTGDIQWVKDRYPFAKTIFDRIAKTEVSGTGLCEGSSLFPDFPKAMSETGNDISGFNNTSFYCAARSMESLAALTGDEEQEKKAAAIIRRFEHHFIPLFFNPEKGFIVSSIDAKTLAQRDSYTINSIRWENNYCADIIDPIDGACLLFFKNNAVTPMGLREIPLWSKSFDMDANQLHCWWPATGEYFMRTANGNDQRQLVEQWIKWVSYWTKYLTCPEGISYYIETDEPEFDRWTSQKGTWQGYSMRSWYQAALHGVVGVGTDAGGVTFYPYSGEEMSLYGLNFRGKKFDVEMKGSGRYIESVTAAGIVIKATNKLPVDLYKDCQRVMITVRRTASNPYPVSIVSGTAIQLEDYHYTNGTIRAKLIGAGLCRLKLRAVRLPTVSISGKVVHVGYDPHRNLAIVELNLKPDQVKEIEIH